MNILFRIVMKPINWVCSFIFGIVATIILLFAAIALTFNVWIPHVAPRLLRGHDGFDLTMGRSDSNIFAMNFNFYDVAIENGDKFPIPNFIQIDRFSVDTLLFSLLSKKVVVENLVLNVPQVTYVKCIDGRNNLTEFLTQLSGGSSPESDEQTVKKERKKKEYSFKHVELSIGKVVFMDFTVQPTRMREIILNYSFDADDIDLDELLRKITSDFKARGVLFLLQAVLEPLGKFPGFFAIAKPIQAVNDVAVEVLDKGIDTGRNLLKKVRGQGE
ncbi:MAG: hypothetical protein LBS68_01410 [Puniceicoccales bacterium]|jgi:hypothetical protein|nr:hypothetical protein [Puniceicoccales bacterium]